MTARSYPISYDIQIHESGASPEWLDNAGRGGADAVVIWSMIYPDDGSFSLMPMSLDGNSRQEVSDDELFKCWSMMAQQLSKSTQLSAGKRDLCRRAFEVVRQVIMQGRNP